MSLERMEALLPMKTFAWLQMCQSIAARCWYRL